MEHLGNGFRVEWSTVGLGDTRIWLVGPSCAEEKAMLLWPRLQLAEHFHGSGLRSIPTPAIALARI
jgi:hypothetical protein